MEVTNTHTAHVAGLAPGARGTVDPRDAARYPWALVVHDAPEPEPEPLEGEGGPLPARAQIEALRSTDSLAYAVAFLDDTRSSVRAAAERAAARLGGPA